MTPVMDNDSFWGRVGEDSALASELIELFLAEGPERFEAVRAAVHGKDADGLRQAAHALKGSVANFSAAPAADAAAALEQMGKSGNLQGADEAFVTLDRQFELLRAALAKFKEGLVL
jgi:HPt (histidine-containing phosphotransfer) domain-containing protein